MSSRTPSSQLNAADDHAAPPRADDATAAVIDVQGVSKLYRSKERSVRAIDGLDLTVGEGEFISLLGPSGCGKSTLLLCVAGLQSYDAGSISVAGMPVRGPYTDCGIVFQTAELLEWRTALANVLLQAEMRGLAMREHRDRALWLLESVGLGGFEDRYPNELSGGMQQRVALCRALLHDPDILLMDEPFGALDALTREQMNADLQQIWLEKRKTVVFVTHSIEEAVFLGDRVVVFTPRPARIALDLPIELERPRRLSDRTSQHLGEYVATIRETFASLGVIHEPGTGRS